MSVAAVCTASFRSFIPGLLIYAVPASLLAQAHTPDTIAAGILASARAEAERETRYIEEYHVLKYPGGDVPPETGVCTDLIVRSFRSVGLDLQKAVHEDRVANPKLYPTSLWPNKKADRNIDHRRCPNLVAWLRRHAQTLPTGLDAQTLNESWKPGDIVFYVRPKATHPWHVAIVSDKCDADGMPRIIDGFPPATSESHRLDTFAPIHSHFRVTRVPRK